MGTSVTELGDINAMEVIGSCGGRGQVVALTPQDKVGVVTLMDCRVKAAIRRVVLTQT